MEAQHCPHPFYSDFPPPVRLKVVSAARGIFEKKNFFFQKRIIHYDSNFFVFQSYELRFLGKFCQVLIRSFPGSFVIGAIPGGTIGVYQVPDFDPNSKLYPPRCANHL